VLPRRPAAVRLPAREVQSKCRVTLRRGLRSPSRATTMTRSAVRLAREAVIAGSGAGGLRGRLSNPGHDATFRLDRTLPVEKSKGTGFTPREREAR
jgi:hypothetical protein